MNPRKKTFNEVMKTGNKMRFDCGGKHKPEVWHIRGFVDDRVVFARWVGSGYSYFVKFYYVVRYWFWGGSLRYSGKSRGCFDALVKMPEKDPGEL